MCCLRPGYVVNNLRHECSSIPVRGWWTIFWHSFLCLHSIDLYTLPQKGQGYCRSYVSVTKGVPELSQHLVCLWRLRLVACLKALPQPHWKEFEVDVPSAGSMWPGRTSPDGGGTLHTRLRLLNEMIFLNSLSQKQTIFDAIAQELPRQLGKYFFITS